MQEQSGSSGANGLRRIRRTRGLTQEAIGLMADLDPATVSRIERGKVQPELETIVKLARGLRLSVSKLRSLLKDDDGARVSPE